MYSFLNYFYKAIYNFILWTKKTPEDSSVLLPVFVLELFYCKISLSGLLRLSFIKILFLRYNYNPFFCSLPPNFTIFPPSGLLFFLNVFFSPITESFCILYSFICLSNVIVGFCHSMSHYWIVTIRSYLSTNYESKLYVLFQQIIAGYGF